MIYYLSTPHLKRKKAQSLLLLSLSTDVESNHLVTKKGLAAVPTICRHFTRAPDRYFTRSLVTGINLFSFTWRQRDKRSTFWCSLCHQLLLGEKKNPCTPVQRFQHMVCLDRSDSSSQLCAVPSRKQSQWHFPTSSSFEGAHTLLLI